MAEHGHGHSHVADREADRRYLSAALVVIALFMIAEIVVGVYASSLALISDAGHMLTDAGALALALVAGRLARIPARGAYTFGLKRAEILSAQINGITLFALVGYFVVEGVRRLIAPPAVAGAFVLVTALVGIVVNLIATWLINKGNRQSLNVEGAFQHILNDLYAFVATAVAGLVVLSTGWTRADALAALVVAALMARAGYGLIRDSARVFLEAAPRGIDPQLLETEIRGVTGVVEVHELHVWEVTSGFPALSAHVLVSADQDCHERRTAVERLLGERHEIRHTTLQVDHRQDFLPTESLRSRAPEEQGGAENETGRG
ncbi:cobalt-zinc-cadmium efflux system protein [Actinopolyspora biskrensis]|uniref:Cobalt-zinc-cadmium efflux system protein n=1 Tax=Actinopolyspora biskrensis TaxID=1470178 RepID=A0A852YWE8_9ACTN|nr:cation diffusion facilitator family transporter [Actinopolyspora biskrensis]NYH78350.1 cobalt-zinc-cadmium efflux system protein [Actinopolyspora biskrensis]